MTPPRPSLLAALGVLFLVLPVTAGAYGVPTHLWSTCFGTEGSSSRSFGVGADNEGNVVFAGSFTGTVNFGGADLTAQATDIVIAKYNEAGVHLWSKRFGGSGADQAYAVAVDAAGSIMVTGYFQGVTNFGGNGMSSTGASDIFVAKYDQDGNHLWSRSIGTTDADIGYSIAADATGNVYVTGYVHGVIPSDIVVWKLNALGTMQWMKILGGEGYDEGLSIAVDSAGNVIVTGSFSGTVDFGGGPLTTPGEYDWDVFVVKFDAAGTHLWSRRFGNGDLEAGLAIKTDPDNNVLVSGYFSGTVNFGGADLSSASADVDIFLAKYDAAGTHVWSRRFGGLSYETGTALAVDGSSNVMLSGYFSGAANFGGADLVSAGNVDVFFAEYRPDGTHVSSQRFGGLAGDLAQAVAVDDAGNRYLTGYFNGTLDFGGGPLVSDGTPDIFLVKYGVVISAADPNPALDDLAMSAAPNPFNPSTTIQYRIPSAGRVSIMVYDIRGRLVATVLDEHRIAGAHTVSWNGREHTGNTAASGVYFARIAHAGDTRTQKLVLLK